MVLYEIAQKLHNFKGSLCESLYSTCKRSFQPHLQFTTNAFYIPKRPILRQYAPFLWQFINVLYFCTLLCKTHLAGREPENPTAVQGDGANASTQCQPEPPHPITHAHHAQSSPCNTSETPGHPRFLQCQ